jgi:hypothetical protein
MIDPAIRFSSTFAVTRFRYPTTLFLGALPVIGFFAMPALMINKSPNFNSYAIRKMFTGVVSKIPGLGERGTAVYILAITMADIIIFLLDEFHSLPVSVKHYTRKILPKKSSAPPDPGAASSQADTVTADSNTDSNISTTEADAAGVDIVKHTVRLEQEKQTFNFMPANAVGNSTGLSSNDKESPRDRAIRLAFIEAQKRQDRLLWSAATALAVGDVEALRRSAAHREKTKNLESWL